MPGASAASPGTEELPLVSVVIPAYNAAAYVGDAIESVLAQTYRPLELIVVDDGSTDATASVVRSYGESVRYVHQANARQAAARNRGIEHARGELVAFLDADDLWLPEKLERQVALYLANPDLGLVYCGLRRVDPAGETLGEETVRLRGRDGVRTLLGEPSGQGSTALVPRAVLDAVGRFDEALPPCEDTDLFWRVGARFSVDYVPDALVLYRIHGTNSHLNVSRMTAAWKGLYRKALADPYVRRLGWRFRARCRGRLYYMLAGDHARAGRFPAASGYAALGAMAWPPLALRVLRGAVASLLRRASR